MPAGETRTVRLGGREVARMGLGTNRLTRTPEHESFIRAAAEAGIGLIDTAHLYTGGQSEATIGAGLSRVGAANGSMSPGTSRPLVATKGGYAGGEGRPEVLRAQIEQSLRVLRVDAIDLWYLHRVHRETPLEASLETVGEFVAAGHIRHVGLSEVGVEQIERGRKVLPIAAVQNHYSLVERRWDEVVDHCAREGIVFVPFFPLRGVAGPTIDRIAAAHGVTAHQVALAWLLQRSPAILPIPGTLSLHHLRENLAALDLELSADDLAALGPADPSHTPPGY
jgi:pyridoxine 4-dehydrogenase